MGARILESSDPNLQSLKYNQTISFIAGYFAAEYNFVYAADNITYLGYLPEIYDQSQPILTPFNYTLVDSAFNLPPCPPAPVVPVVPVAQPAPSAPNATDAFQAWFNFQKSKNNTNFNYTVGTPKTFWV